MLQVAKLGDPVLRQKAKIVELGCLKEKDSKTQVLIDDMIETMREEDGVGLAAPQVFQSLRLVVIECALNRRYSDVPNIPLTVLINPSIQYHGEDIALGWEGCLSLRDLRGLVPRFKKITVEYFDRKGKPITVDAEGFPSVVLQHEIDHLDGKVFLDRMADLSHWAYLEEFEKYIGKKESLDQVRLPNGEIFDHKLHGPASEEFIGCVEDYDLWLRLSNVCIMTHVPECLGVANQHENNQSKKMTPAIFHQRA